MSSIRNMISNDILDKIGAKSINEDMVYSGYIDSQKYYPKSLTGADYVCPTCGGVSGIVCKEANNTSWILCSSFSCQREQLKGKRAAWRNPLSIKNYVDEEYWDAKLSKLHVENAELVSALRELGEKKKGFVVLAGPNGNGKTWCAAAACSHYIDHEGDDLKFYKSGDLYIKFLSEFEEYGNHSRLRTSLLEKDFLVIDDIGIKAPTEPFKEFLYLIIDGRLNKKLPTIITTNLTLRQIKEYFGSAIASRITACKVFLFDGYDQRGQKGSVSRV